jgi:hypothetical protein
MVRKPRTVHVAKVTNTIKGATYTSYYRFIRPKRARLGEP